MIYTNSKYFFFHLYFVRIYSERFLFVPHCLFSVTHASSQEFGELLFTFKDTKAYLYRHLVSKKKENSLNQRDGQNLIVEATG